MWTASRCIASDAWMAILCLAAKQILFSSLLRLLERAPLWHRGQRNALVCRAEKKVTQTQNGRFFTSIFFCFGFIKFKRWSHSTQPFSHSFFQSIKCSSIQGDVRQLENRQVFNGKVLQAYSCVVLLWIWALLICICPPLSFCNLLAIVTVRSSKQYSMYSASFGVQTKNVLTG